MRITVAPIGIEIGTIELKIRAPGIVRYVAFEHKPKLVMTKGDPGFEERPVIFVESSPDGPLVTRRFAAIRQGDYLDPDEGKVAVWAGTGLSGGGMIVHIFEIRDAPT